MSCRGRVLGWSLAAGAVLAATGATLRADTIAVPGDFATIQGAINAASNGDTILVSPGNYNENININKANLQVLSTDGAGSTRIFANTDDTPVVTIAAGGVILGAPEQGFKIEQQDATHPGNHAGDCCVRVDGAAVGARGIIIEDNALVGNNTDEGILVNPALKEAALIVRGNSFTKLPAATHSFRDCIHLHWTDYMGSVGQASLFASQLDILDNAGLNFARSAIYIHDDVHASIVNITGNDFSGDAASQYGIYFADYIRAFSTVTVDANEFTNEGDGLYVSNDLDELSHLTVSNSTFDGLTGEGIYLSGYVEGLSTLTITDCALEGNGTANDGIYAYAEYGGQVLIDGNTISGFYDYGIESGAYYGSDIVISNNTIDMSTGGSGYGLYTYTEDGSTTLVQGNDISGFDVCGIYEAYPEYGSIYTCDGNTLTADSGGADYGIWVDATYYGAHSVISNNVVTGFTYAGYYEGSDIYYGSSVQLLNNTFTARSAGGADYGMYVRTLYDGSERLVQENTFENFFLAGVEHGDIEYDSQVTFDGNVFTALSTGAEYGLFFDYVEYGSSLTVTGNEVSGFGNTGGTEYGLYAYEIYEGGDCIVNDNTFTAHENGADYGIYLSSGFDYGSYGEIRRNTISGYTDTGYYTYYCEDGSETHVTDNVLTAADSGSVNGMYFSDGFDYGGVNTINNNVVSGYTDYGIYIYELDDGAQVTMDGNAFTAHSGGTEYHMYVSDGLDYGSIMDCTNNTFTGDVDATYYAVYFYQVEDGSILTLADNQIDATGGDHGLYLEYPAYYGGITDVLRNSIGGATLHQIFCDNYLSDGAIMRVEENTLTGGQYGLYFDDYLEPGTLLEVRRNLVEDFTLVGMYFNNEVQSTHLNIHGNKIAGDSADTGVQFGATINGASEVNVTHNCFSGVEKAVLVETVEQAAEVHVNQNDFAGLIGVAVGIENTNGDAAHAIDGTENWWGADSAPGTGGSADVVGEVETDPFLSSPPDEDGDGVIDCDDLCPDTEAGDVADADGCSCVQLDPVTDTDGDGTIDCDDLCPEDAAKTEPGQCGCGVADTDTDGDGVADCVDNCVDEPNPDQADEDGDGIGDVCDEEGGQGTGGDCCGGGLPMVMPLMLLGWQRMRRRGGRARRA